MQDSDKRYQVFVSSTYADLKAEREEVIRALLELDCIPAGMELFPASDDERWELIRRVIDDCDYYIVIVGGRYGSTDEQGISYTEREYDYAVSKGIPVLGFLHADPQKVEIGKTDISEDAQTKLDAFRHKVEERMCKYWTNPQELGGSVSRSLVQQMKTRPGVGWVRGDRAASPETLHELADLRNVNAQLRAELAAPNTEPPEGAEELAQGEETIELDYSVRRLRTGLASGNWSYTWNEILGFVGPLMFDEASELQLLRHFNKVLQRDVEKAHGEQLAEIGRYNDIVLTDTSFHAIKVQFAALGVIEKSIRQRSVKDQNTYWTLTPYGEHLVLSLSAIPSGETRPKAMSMSDDDHDNGKG